MIELDGTVFDFLQTAHCEPFFTKLPFVDALYDGRGIFPKSVVEVYGQVTHTPVSILLQHIAAQFVLPKSCGGMDGVVYYFDHDKVVQAQLFSAILSKKVGRDNSESQKFLESCMERVNVYRCNTTFEWIASLSYIEQCHAIDQPNKPILILIDSVDSFYLMDKMLEKRVGGGLTMTHQCFAALRRLVNDTGAIMFASKKAYGSDVRRPTDHLEYMSNIWSSMVNKRITLASHPSLHAAPSPDSSRIFEARFFQNGKSYKFYYSVDKDSVKLVSPPIPYMNSTDTENT